MQHHHSRAPYAIIACTGFLIGMYVSDLMRLTGSRRFIRDGTSVGAANILRISFASGH